MHCPLVEGFEDLLLPVPGGSFALVEAGDQARGGVLREPEPPVPDPINVSPVEVNRWLEGGRDLLLLDVRTPREWQVCRLAGAELIPLQELAQRWQEIDGRREIVVYCHHGHRSARAVDFLKRMGLGRVRNLAGGIDAWSKTVDPSIPIY